LEWTVNNRRARNSKEFRALLLGMAMDYQQFYGNRPTEIVSGPNDYVYRREMTLEERLAEERILFLWGEINPVSAGRLIMQLLEMQAKHSDRAVSIYINSPGGSVDDTLAIYDTMSFMSCDVATYCVGQAASGAAIVLAAGTPGHRFCLPHSRVMIHQPYGGVTGQAADIKIQAEEILKAKKTLNGLLAELTGRTSEQIAEDTERDRFLTPAEAVDYGLVDEIVEVTRKRKPKKK
jgi:ATP-dependent Clp protease protease subunit